MQIRLEKRLSLGHLHTLEEVWAGIRELNQSLVMDKWESIRQTILHKSLRHVRTSVRESLEAASPGLAAYLDGRWHELRRAARIDVDLLKHIGSHETRRLVGNYCYWMYSNDILGRGKGWSKTYLGNQFGEPFGLHQSGVTVAISCPSCSKSAQLTLRETLNK